MHLHSNHNQLCCSWPLIINCVNFFTALIWSVINWLIDLASKLTALLHLQYPPSSSSSSVLKDVFNSPDSGTRAETPLPSRWRCRNAHTVKFDDYLGPFPAKNLLSNPPRPIIYQSQHVIKSPPDRLCQAASGPPAGQKMVWPLFLFIAMLRLRLVFFFLLFFFPSLGEKERSTVKQLVFQVKCCGTEGWSVWLSLIASVLIDQSVVLRPESLSLLSFLSATASRSWCHKGQQNLLYSSELQNSQSGRF